MSMQNRFCILEYGILSYYEKNLNQQKHTPSSRVSQSMRTFPSVLMDSYERSATKRILERVEGSEWKGDIILHKATVLEAEKGLRFRVSSICERVKDFLFEAETPEDAVEWVNDIKAHIEFANSFPYLIDLRTLRIKRGR